MDFGALIGSPVFQFLASLLSSRSQQGAQDEANQRTDQQIAESLGLAQNRATQGLNIYDDSAMASLRELMAGIARTSQQAGALPGQAEADRQGFLGEFDRRGQQLQQGYGIGLDSFLQGLAGQNSELQQGYADRYRMAEENLKGYGDQQKADIDRRFDDERGRLEQDLISRGIMSSNAGAKDLLGVTERRSAEQRRLGEDLARNKINILSDLSGQGLAARERLGGQQAGYRYGGMQAAYGQQGGLDSARAAYDAAMRGDVRAANQMLLGYDQSNSQNLANWYGTNAANRSNLYMQGTGDQLNTLTGINYIPPPSNQLPFLFGQNSVQAAQAPGFSFSSLFGPLLGAGGNVAGGAFAGGYF